MSYPGFQSLAPLRAFSAGFSYLSAIRVGIGIGIEEIPELQNFPAFALPIVLKMDYNRKHT